MPLNTSLASQWTRIVSARENIKTALRNKGLNISKSAKLEDIPASVDSEYDVPPLDLSVVSSVVGKTLSDTTILSSYISEGTPYALAGYQAVSDLTSYSGWSTIAEGAFAGTGVSEASFPLCETIGSYAFEDCTSLTSVSFPACVSISKDAFKGCSSLSYAEFPNCTSLESGAFDYCQNLHVSLPNYSGSISGVFNEVSKITIKCSSIAPSAFKSAYGLPGIVFKSCTSIGNRAFQDCKLSYLEFPDVTNIGSSVFVNCTNLSVNFPNYTGNIKGKFTYSVYGDEFNEHEYIYMPGPRCITFGKLKSIPDLNGYDASDKYFAEMPCLEEVNFPSCSYIGYSAFIGCSDLKRISFPECKIVGENAFVECLSLSEASFPKCTTISIGAFNNCYSLSSISFPACTSLGDMAFYGCSSLKEVALPECLEVSNYAFAQCISLSSISLPKATTIGQAAFYSCPSLSEINLPEVSSIRDGAFNSCVNLSVIRLGTSRCSIPYSSVFSGTLLASGIGSIYVPSSYVEAYKAAQGWKYFSSLIIGY